LVARRFGQALQNEVKIPSLANGTELRHRASFTKVEA
jgi:hypothetical protein